ncbi:MAG: hypothetical protein H6706_02930 [Myxococcales bacterium]|nr:hypothetical protein [Myxococcales bacterium]
MRGGLVLLALLGGVLGTLATFLIVFTTGAGLIVQPAPYRVPPTPGGTALRLAMVHDVLHQRYPQHGPAWQRATISRTRALISAAGGRRPLDLATLDAFDDLAVALDRSGRPAEAIDVLRRKQSLTPWPEPRGQDDTRAGQVWYRTHANLGTVILHAHLGEALAGDAAALVAARRGVEHLRKSVILNPGAHFGRERWQIVVVERLLAAAEQPTALLEADILGLPLDGAPWQKGGVFLLPLSKDLAEAIDRGQPVERPNEVRSQVRRVEIGEGVPFDEPTLGLLGMWMLGGGPNPHSALALGHLMEAARQPRIAWAAYARARALGDRFSRDPVTRDALLAHCAARQAALEADLGESAATLQAEHDRELALGLAWQAAQAAREESLYSADDLEGTRLLATDTAALVTTDRGPIATPPGPEDLVLFANRLADPSLLAAGALNGAALFAWLGVLTRRRRRSAPPG